MYKQFSSNRLCITTSVPPSLPPSVIILDQDPFLLLFYWPLKFSELCICVSKIDYLTRCALSRLSIVLTDFISFSGMCDVTTNGVAALAVVMETDPVSDVPLCLFIFIPHSLYFISLVRDFQN